MNNSPKKNKDVGKQAAIVMTIIFGIITIFLFKLHWIFGCIGLIAVLTCLLTALFPQYAPSSKPVYILDKKNHDGKKYHYDRSCSSIRGLPSQLTTESIAVKKGYTKCSKCCK